MRGILCGLCLFILLGIKRFRVVFRLAYDGVLVLGFVVAGIEGR